MRLTPKEPKIKIGVDGFEHDKLGRKDTGNKLSRLVENLESPTVIALDGSWGSGKSFFLKCWCGEHMKEGNDNKAEVIYFDAFEHDFLDDPLIALTMAISEKMEPGSLRAHAWSKAKEAVPMLARLALRTGVGVLTGGLVQNADKMAESTVKTVVTAATSVVTDEVNALADKTTFWEQEQGKLAAMKAFKEALKSLVTVSGKDEPAKPLVIIIDELDRCRPDYALSMLEIMKHFFAVDGVHFVLGVNLKELENSVKARYGPDIKAERYLQKFVHFRMSLPRQNYGREITLEYVHDLAAELGLSADVMKMAKEVCKISKTPEMITLRAVERFLSVLVVVNASLSNKIAGYQMVLFVGAFIKTFHTDYYEKYRNGTITMAELAALFELDPYWQAALQEAVDRTAHPEESRVLVESLFRGGSLANHPKPTAHLAENYLEAFDFRVST